MHSRKLLAATLASAFVGGPVETDALVEHVRVLLLDKRKQRWLKPLVKRFVQAYSLGPRPRQPQVEAFLLADYGFLKAYHKNHIRLSGALAPSPVMSSTIESITAADRISLITPAELARWLDLPIRELDWFADRRGWEAKHANAKLQHYRYLTFAKPSRETRLVEAPKPRLKGIQRRIITDILNHVRPHEAAHGFRTGHSVRSFAEPHVGKRVVLKLDLRNFFPSIRAAQIHAIFRSIGYPDAVASLLTGLCTNTTPSEIWAERLPLALDFPMYERPHLPQGAPTSPALANLAAYRLDARLGGLAKSAGANYTRYADDLAFSGNAPFERVVRRFADHVAATVMEEGFFVHHRKTRIMPQGVRQRIAGVIVNEHPNVDRRTYDRLKAVLTNCVRLGPDSQNNDAHEHYRHHLEGQVSWVESINPQRGQRLRELVNRITW